MIYLDIAQLGRKTENVWRIRNGCWRIVKFPVKNARINVPIIMTTVLNGLNEENARKIVIICNFTVSKPVNYVHLTKIVMTKRAIALNGPKEDFVLMKDTRVLWHLDVKSHANFVNSKFCIISTDIIFIRPYLYMLTIQSIKAL